MEDFLFAAMSTDGSAACACIEAGTMMEAKLKEN
jgi:hypothetical protein